MARHGKCIRIALPVLFLCASLPARAELDLMLFRAASCTALASEFAAVRDVNPAALKEMRRTESASPESGSTDIAATATPGLRAMLAKEHADEETSLTELAAYRQAIVTVAEEKKCARPGSGPGPTVPQ